MNLVATYKMSGSLHLLWPEGVTSVEQVPDALTNAINHAVRIISWMENYTDEETPPKWMWHLEHELEPWFAEVKRVKNQQNSSSGYEEAKEEGEYMSNEFTAGLR